MDKDSLQELCDFADEDPDTINEIFKQVKRNHKKLDECVGPHDFKPLIEDGDKLIRDYRCTRCGGVIDAINKIWYDRGRIHGLEDGLNNPRC